jgi:hypothetical protein
VDRHLLLGQHVLLLLLPRPVRHQPDARTLSLSLSLSTLHTPYPHRSAFNVMLENTEEEHLLPIWLVYVYQTLYRLCRRVTNLPPDADQVRRSSREPRRSASRADADLRKPRALRATRPPPAPCARPPVAMGGIDGSIRPLGGSIWPRTFRSRAPACSTGGIP